MSSWLVTQGDRQFSTPDLDSLQRLAKAGDLSPSDMVQAPGASDWLYASELPELNGLFTASSQYDDDDDLSYKRPGIGQTPQIIALIALFLGGAYAMYYYANRVPSDSELSLLGEHGLALSEMLVTSENAVVHANPEANAPAVGNLAQNTTIQLKAKRGDFYKIETDDVEGWVAIGDVVPAYFFADERTREDYDPVYNPDTYVYVKNSSWMQLPGQQASNTTVFQFLLQNKSKFEMTDIILLATIKDGAGRVLEHKEIPMEGSIAPYESTQVGTLSPSDDEEDGVARQMTQRLFGELYESDPDLSLRWSLGVEVQMDTQGYSDANIDLLELRAVPRQLD